MQAIQPILLGLGMLFAEGGGTIPKGPDLAHLREMLHDRQHALGQAQAALLLVESKLDGADKLVHEGLRNIEDVEMFLALAAAVRMHRDRRFVDELFTALSVRQPTVREAAAQTLAVLADGRLVKRLQQLAADREAEPATRQIALWTLGRCGSKQAAQVLLDHLTCDVEPLRRAAASALHELSGQDFGTDVGRWQGWWERHKDLSNERWLEARLAYQTSWANRLEGDLARSRAQTLRLQQQLYGRLSGAERVSHIQSLVEQDDPAVRLLAVNWGTELMPAAEAAHKRLLTQVLMRLSHDSAAGVQRAAVLGLGHVHESAVFELLRRLVDADAPAVRTAVLHALTLHARGEGVDVSVRRKQVMPFLQKALDDPALEVVVEAAEDLGALGEQEAGPILIGLLRHSSGPVRQAAAQALERVAEPAVLPSLLGALNDHCATVRFNLVGAMARAAGDGDGLSEDQRKKVLARLEELLLRDSDPGVRSRAATVLGECAPPAQLGTLWRCVLAGEDVRVQEKAWAAFVDILARAGQLSLLEEWDRTLVAARQGPRRLQLLNEVVTRWQKQPQHKALVVPAQEMLVQTQLESGKWSAAAPLVRDLLTRSAGDAELNRRLSWLLAVGQQAMREENRTEAQRAVETAQPFLPRTGNLTDEFEKLRQKLSQKE
jgi:HEAT repeat protein